FTFPNPGGTLQCTATLDPVRCSIRDRRAANDGNQSFALSRVTSLDQVRWSVMSTIGYAAVGQARGRELPTRLALAVFIGGTAMLMAPSIWPAVWFVAMLAGQALDWLAFRAVRLNPEAEVSAGRRAVCVASVLVNTAIYSAITVYLWF